MDDKIFKYDELQFDKFEDLKEIENHCVLVLDFSGTFELVGINYWKGIEGKIK